MKLAISFATALLLLAGSSFVANAADGIEVKECKEFMCLGTQSGMTVTIPNADEAEVMKEWKRLMKRYDAEVTEWPENIYAENTELEAALGSPVDIYAVFDEVDGGTKISLFLYHGDAFITSANNKAVFNKAVEFLGSFATRVSKEA